jgi:hypothetical protein
MYIRISLVLTLLNRRQCNGTRISNKYFVASQMSSASAHLLFCRPMLLELTAAEAPTKTGAGEAGLWGVMLR